MLEAVSCHAVIRYLERVLGLPVAEWLAGADHLDEHQRAVLCCERAGLPVAAVRQSILSRPVMMAILAGFRQVIVRHEGFAYVIRSGKLVTIVTERMRDEKIGQGKKMKLKGRMSMRREIQKANRRNKARDRSRDRRRLEEA